MDKIEVIKLSQSQESEKLEFKAKFPHRGTMASLMSSMANTQGGVILIGVAKGGGIPGVQKHEWLLESVHDTAANLCTPPVPIEFADFIDVDSNSVLALRIGKSPYIHATYRGDYLLREGDRILPASPEEIKTRILEKVMQFPDPLEKLTQQISETLKVVEGLQQNQGWKNKIIEWSIAGFIGATIGLILTLIFFR